MLLTATSIFSLPSTNFRFTMVCLQPFGIVLMIILFLVILTWTSAQSWARGFTLAWEGCAVGAFDEGGLVEGNHTYSEGLAYATKNPPLQTAVKQAHQARVASIDGVPDNKGEGFVYRNTEVPEKKNTAAHHYVQQEGLSRKKKRSENFTNYDYVIPGMQGVGAATPTSPFVGHL